MKTFKFKLYCRQCKKIVEVYNCHREKSVLPETNPKFDVITVCCSICKKPIMKMTELHSKKRKEKR
ncbi:MAG: hypothetical protein OEY95_03010 [Candidatus Bathyarchaeota archaeon]|nr:hypothetical protein [Candidatus Bathyarchaeota archaeon]